LFVKENVEETVDGLQVLLSGVANLRALLGLPRKHHRRRMVEIEE
jgi:hypothetical protein